MILLAAAWVIKTSLPAPKAAIEVSRATMGNIKQNLVGAFIYNTLGVLVAITNRFYLPSMNLLSWKSFTHTPIT